MIYIRLKVPDEIYFHYHRPDGKCINLPWMQNLPKEVMPIYTIPNIDELNKFEATFPGCYEIITDDEVRHAANIETEVSKLFPDLKASPKTQLAKNVN